MSKQPARHKPRDGGGRYHGRNLPEELKGSNEAAEVWEAAKSVSVANQIIEVRNWRVEWRPRGALATGKRGDLYIIPPIGCGFGRPIRSLSALGDILALRHAALQGGSSVWEPPTRSSLIEVRLSADDLKAHGEAVDEDAIVWRRAEVRKVEMGLGGSFRVVVHMLSGEALVRWCSAWDECIAWRRIDGQPLFAPTRPGKRSIRRGRCGQCAGCAAVECGACSACRDKPKFGGKGSMKQACAKRRCANPSLPVNADRHVSEEPTPQCQKAGSTYSYLDAVIVGGRDADAETGGNAETGWDDQVVAAREVDNAALRRQLLDMHRCANLYRLAAEEITHAAMSIYPLALAEDGALTRPTCFTRALPSMPPLSYVLPCVL